MVHADTLTICCPFGTTEQGVVRAQQWTCIRKIPGSILHTSSAQTLTRVGNGPNAIAVEILRRVMSVQKAGHRAYTYRHTLQAAPCKSTYKHGQRMRDYEIRQDVVISKVPSAHMERRTGLKV